MKDLIKIELSELPPTVNHLYRNSARGIRYKTKAGRAWQDNAAAILKTAWGKRAPYGGLVTLDILFQTKDRRHWDIDNRVKALQDCLQISGVLSDDAQVEELHVKRRRGAKQTMTVIQVREWENAEG